MIPPRGKLVYDVNNKTLRQKTVEVINCGSFLDYGGYAADGGYRVPAQKLYMLRLLDKGRGMETVGFYV